LIIANSEAMRIEQDKISAHVFELLGLRLGSHNDTPLAPTMSTAKKRKAAAPG
jgi:hypothetical protein